MRFLPTRRILYWIGFLLCRRLEATLDSYKSGTKAASQFASHWVSVTIGILWWLMGYRSNS